MEKDAKIYVAGHKGLVGSAICRRLKEKGYANIIVRSHAELDLTDQKAVEGFFDEEKPEYVFVAAAKVGGILANSTYPADFIYNNLVIATNIIHASYKGKVKRLLNLGSSCIYPKLAPQPIKEEHLLTGSLEPTNEAYAIAKIAALKLCEFYNRQYGTDFVSLMPSNLYGPGDNFDLRTSHVLPALLRKFHEGKAEGKDEVVVWGDGTPLREFLYVDDLADACVFIVEKNGRLPDLINVGTGEEISIKELAEEIKNAAGYDGRIVWDSTKPNGTPRKVVDVSRIHALGWRHKTALKDGIRKTYEWYMSERT